MKISVKRDIRSDNALRFDIHGYSSLTFAVSWINTVIVDIKYQQEKNTLKFAASKTARNFIPPNC